MDKISIIVPVYNVERYLERCIESLLQQTYKELEIILVDDGSPDNCPAICDFYAQKDVRIRVIHKKNGGLSDARNAGTRCATGAYIGFIDSDDFVEPDMFEKLYKAIKKENADIAVCGFERVDTGGEKLGIDLESPIKAETVSASEFMKKIVKGNGWYYTVAWNKLYSRKVAEAVMFPVGKIHEDEYTIHLFVNQCNRITVIDEICYHYTMNPKSITGAGYNSRRLMGIEALMERSVFFAENGYEDLVGDTEASVYYGFCEAITKLDWEQNKKYIKEYLKKYRKILPRIIKYCNWGWKRQIRHCMLLYYPAAFKIIFTGRY